jgi:hypothetical protein
MKIALALAAFLAATTAAYAACSTHSYVVNGKLIICTTCCSGSMCNTTCI